MRNTPPQKKNPASFYLPLEGSPLSRVNWHRAVRWETLDNLQIKWLIMYDTALTNRIRLVVYYNQHSKRHPQGQLGWNLAFKVQVTEPTNRWSLRARAPASDNSGELEFCSPLVLWHLFAKISPFKHNRPRCLPSGQVWGDAAFWHSHDLTWPPSRPGRQLPSQRTGGKVRKQVSGNNWRPWQLLTLLSALLHVFLDKACSLI